MGLRSIALRTAVLVLLALLSAAHAQHITLNIASQPGGAQVYLDDRPRGMTSTEEGKLVLDDLAAGTFQVRLSLSGYKDWIQSVTLTQGSTIYVDAALAIPGPAPLAAQDVVELLRGEVSAKRATVLVTQRGVDFDLTAPIEQQIRAAGGDADLLLAITKAKVAPPPAPPPLMPPTLTLLEPADAERGKPIEASGATLRVRGTAYHRSGIASVSVNGQAALLKVSASGEVEFEAPNLSLNVASSALVLIATAADRSQAQLHLPIKVGETPGATKVNPKDSLTYVWIPPGTFQMGCSPGDNECTSDERPAHPVTITKGFWMGETEVTQGAYQRVTGANPSYFRGERLPVEQVTWGEARAYCAAVGMRLPTEAEWEYAARAGSTASRYGDLDAIAWGRDDWGSPTHEVGLKQPNAWGLFDTLGNVEEWVADWLDGSYYAESPSRDPQGPSSGQNRILRGGSRNYGPGYVRVTSRAAGDMSSHYRESQYGFRCAGELP